MNKKKILLILILSLAVFLRFFYLGKNPVGIYWDEAAIGIDAYTLSENLKDQYARPWHQLIFPSYGDYKAPVYIWLTAISVKAFGLNEFAVRFPSAFFGSLTVLLVYYLVKELFKKKKLEIGLIASFLLAISPWHLQFSRIGFESNLSLFWLVLCLYLFLKGLEKGAFLILASISGTAAVYSYFSARVILPVILTLSTLIFLKKIWQKKFWFLSGAIIFILLLIPLFRSPLYAKSQQLRMSADNILNNNGIIIYSSQLVEEDNLSLLGRLFHHRYYYLIREFLINYSQHFSFQFLFLDGDSNLRHHTGFGGELYFVFIPFLLLGLYFLIKKFNNASFFLFVWLFASPIAASVPYEVPHASRAIYMIIPLVIICAVGFYQLYKLLKGKLRIILLTTYYLLLTINVFLYLHDYFVHYPNRSCQFWQDGYKELMVYLKDNQEDYDEIYVTGRYRLPYLYYLFYFQPPVGVIQDIQKQRLKGDPFNFSEPGEINNVYFGLKDANGLDKKALFVFGEEKEEEIGLKFKDQINFVNNEPAFYIFEN